MGNAYSLSLRVKVSAAYLNGRVDQPGMIATLASWRSRVRIPPRPPIALTLMTSFKKMRVNQPSDTVTMNKTIQALCLHPQMSHAQFLLFWAFSVLAENHHGCPG